MSRGTLAGRRVRQPVRGPHGVARRHRQYPGSICIAAGQLPDPGRARAHAAGRATSGVWRVGPDHRAPGTSDGPDCLLAATTKPTGWCPWRHGLTSSRFEGYPSRRSRSSATQTSICSLNTGPASRLPVGMTACTSPFTCWRRGRMTDPEWREQRQRWTVQFIWSRSTAARSLGAAAEPMHQRLLDLCCSNHVSVAAASRSRRNSCAALGWKIR